MAVEPECTFNLSHFFKSFCMNREQKAEFIDHSSIAGDIWIAVRAVGKSSDLSPSGNRSVTRREEKAAGRSLISDIVAERLGEENLKIESAENQKPFASYNGRPVQISIAHTRNMICAAVSERKRLGIDLEPVQREVNPRLRKRILHQNESEVLQKIPTLQLWTIKEAALKWLGSGLRTDMNSVHVVSAENPLFHMKFPDGRHAVVCSFEYSSHWISIAYDAE